MSPTINDLVKRTGKELKPGDVLVSRWPQREDKYYEVIENDVTVEAGLLSKVTGHKETKGIRVRELTSHGPMEGSSFLAVSGGEAYDSFVGIVRSGERTDRPSHHER